MDKVGNGWRTAHQIGVLNGRRFRIRETVGERDPIDMFKLRLTDRSTFHLTLKGLQANADVLLVDRRKRVVTGSRQPGRQAEGMQQTLDAGVYYLKVMRRGSSTGYQLSMSATATPTHNRPLSGDRWLYQLQNAAIEDLSRTQFNLLTIDYSRDGSNAQRYSPHDLSTLQGRGKTVLAYLSIGEAEDYRYYFNPAWVSYDPQSGFRQPDADAPDWLGRTNRDWEGNYKVRYWSNDWQTTVLGYVDQIINAGFNGVYLDIIDAFEYWSDPQNGEGLVLSPTDAANRMMQWVERIAHHARVVRGKTEFYIVPQNGESILAYDQDKSYLQTISGIGVEDVFYDEVRPQPPRETAYRIQWLDQIQAANKPVLAVDYVDDGSGYSNANRTRIDDFRSRALAKGYVPYVARSDRELDRIHSIPGIQD